MSDDEAQKTQPSKSWRPSTPCCIALLVVFGCTLGAAWYAGLNTVFGAIDVATPEYQVLNKGQGYEIRLYNASTAVSVGGATGSHGSFMRLAGFIGVMGKPQNDQHEKIAMTAPVVTIPDGNREEMQFILPREVNNTAPQPTAAGVHLVARPASAFGVETFSGKHGTQDAEKHAQALALRLKADGYTLKNETWQFFRYNPPWTLPFLRTNEVAVPILVQI